MIVQLQKVEREVNNMKAYNLYYNQKVKLIPAESFFAVYWSQKSWYTKGTVLFIEDAETGDLRKFVVEQVLTSKVICGIL